MSRGGMAVSPGAVDPVRALDWSAVVDGVVAVPTTAVMMRTARTGVMGAFAVRGTALALGWAATGLMLRAVLAMFGTPLLA